MVLINFFSPKKISLRALDELDYGVCEGLTMQEIASTYPNELKTMNSYRLVGIIFVLYN